MLSAKRESGKTSGGKLLIGISFIMYNGAKAKAALANFPTTRHGEGKPGRFFPPNEPTFLFFADQSQPRV